MITQPNVSGKPGQAPSHRVTPVVETAWLPATVGTSACCGWMMGASGGTVAGAAGFDDRSPLGESW
jgi:hypothetical protein